MLIIWIFNSCFLKFMEHTGCEGHGPCIHGACRQAQNGSYICNCNEGWYGIECDVPGMIFCLDFITLRPWYPMPYTVAFALFSSWLVESTSFVCVNAPLEIIGQYVQTPSLNVSQIYKHKHWTQFGNLQGAMVMGPAFMVGASKPPMAPSVATATRDGVVQSATCQVAFPRGVGN